MNGAGKLPPDEEIPASSLFRPDMTALSPVEVSTYDETGKLIKKEVVHPTLDDMQRWVRRHIEW